MKQTFLKGIGECLKDSENDKDGKILAEFKDWRSSTKLEELSKTTIHKKDVSVPLDLCRDLSPEAIERRYEDIILNDSNLTSSQTVSHDPPFDANDTHRFYQWLHLC